MKINIIVLFLFTTFFPQAQSISCQELCSAVTSGYDYSDNTSCYASSMLAEAEYYEYNNMGFVVANIKDRTYNISGEP